jgi:hypothetical protein
MHNMMTTIENLIPRNQTTYMFLGEHTKINGFNILNKYYEYKKSLMDKNTQTSDKLPPNSNNLIYNKHPDTYNLAHFYPVLPFEYVSTDNVRTKFDSKKHDTKLIGSTDLLRTGSVDVYHALFVMQGKVYVSIYFDMYVYLYAYISLYKSVCIYIHVYTYIYVYVYVYVYTDMFVCIIKIIYLYVHIVYMHI